MHHTQPQRLGSAGYNADMTTGRDSLGPGLGGQWVEDGRVRSAQQTPSAPQWPTGHSFASNQLASCLLS